MHVFLAAIVRGDNITVSLLAAETAQEALDQVSETGAYSIISSVPPDSLRAMADGHHGHVSMIFAKPR